jgi:glucoamylase
VTTPALEEWIAAEARIAAVTMARAISATDLVMERAGFGQRITPQPGSVLASPVIAHYDPDPDYFFHWFRDSAIVIDALRVALAAGYLDRSALTRLQEFVQFSLSLLALDGAAFLGQHDLRAAVQPQYLQYLRPEEELRAISGQAVLADTRVNADGSLDIIRWSRPQTDGPAMRGLALLRWWRELSQPQEHPTLRRAMSELLDADLAFTLAYVRRPSSDIWEETVGYHYYTQLLQAEALRCGAEWSESAGRRASAGRWAEGIEETLARLDGFWDASRGLYLARARTEPANTERELDISTILGVLHAGRASGRHSVLDPRAQATLTALEELFEARYAINRGRPPERGPALGRYGLDRYYGGGAWYLATLAAAEFYFRLAQALGGGARLARVGENARFRARLEVGAAASDPQDLARRALARGDSFMRTVRAFTPQSGELSEQFDRSSGLQSSAKHLSWSYAAFITAAAQRLQACRAIEGSDPGAPRANTG